MDVYLDQVVEHGGFSQEGVAAVEDGLHASLVRVRESVWGVALHVTPHLLVHLNFRVPKNQTPEQRHHHLLTASSLQRMALSSNKTR